jgi:hypothetical protein
MVPQCPSFLGGPRSGNSDQVAAIGPDEEIGFDQRVEPPTHTPTCAFVVEQQQLRNDASAGDPKPASVADIGDRLLYAGSRQTSLEHVPPRE